MSYQYQCNFMPAAENNIMGKRLYCELERSLHQSWQSQPSKRPRRIVTPGSAISAITQEDESSATISPPLAYEEGPACPRFESFDYPPVIPVNVFAPYPNPTEGHSYEEVQSPRPELRSDEDIQADICNSFTGAQCGTGAWSNELLIQVLANEIEDLIYSNDERQEVVDAGPFQTFYSSYKQPFELDFYMRRLVQYVNCSTSVFVTMFVYLDRVQEKCKELMASDMNCHRLVFTCLVLAVKYLEDEVHSNAYYARVGGLTVDEMNNLEVKLLNVLNWDLSVNPETYAVYEEGMMQTASLLLGGGNGGLQRSSY